MKPAITNRIPNWLIILVFFSLSGIALFIGNWFLHLIGLPRGILGLWVMVGVIFVLDIVCRIGFINYESIFTFLNRLDIRDKIVFWGTVCIGSLPLVVFLQLNKWSEASALAGMVLLLTFLLIYLPIRLFGSSKLKERILEKKL